MDLSASGLGSESKNKYLISKKWITENGNVMQTNRTWKTLEWVYRSRAHVLWDKEVDDQLFTTRDSIIGLPNSLMKPPRQLTDDFRTWVFRRRSKWALLYPQFSFLTSDGVFFLCTITSTPRFNGFSKLESFFSLLAVFAAARLPSQKQYK